MNIAKRLKVLAIPLFKDNYSYIVLGCSPNSAILIDPAVPSVIYNFVTKYLPTYKINHILYTHKHWDHAGSSEQLIQLINNKDLVVVSGQQDSKHIKGVTLPVSKDQQISLSGFKVKVLQVPCHTRGHVFYYFDTHISPSSSTQDIKQEQRTTDQNKPTTIYQTSRCVFVGDTIFIGGTGNFFQGTAEEMNKNYKKFVELEDDTDVFCGHQYTKSNVEWSSKVDYENEELLKYKQEIKGKEVTIPSTVGLEKKINVFLRSLQPKGVVGKLSKDPVELLRILREMKSNKKTLIE